MILQSQKQPSDTKDEAPTLSEAKPLQMHLFTVRGPSFHPGSKLAEKLAKFKEERDPPVAVTLDFHATELIELNQLAAFIKAGEYPQGMTIQLTNTIIPLYNLTSHAKEQLAKNLLDAFIHSLGKGLHLYISRFIFAILRDDFFYTLLRYSECLASLHLVQGPSELKLTADAHAVFCNLSNPQILRPQLVRRALLANTHLLALEIDDFYYTKSRLCPGYPASYVPDFLDVEEKHETDVPRTLLRNQHFEKGLKDKREHYLNDYFAEEKISWPKALSGLVHEYAMEPGEQIAETAIAEFTSLDAIRQNQFETFCVLYLEYRQACQSAFGNSPQFKKALRQYMRPFFSALHEAYTIKESGLITTEFFDDLFYFVQLAKITSAELERQIVFLPTSTLTFERMLVLRKACIDHQNVQFLCRPLTNDSFILDLKPGSIVRIRPSLYNGIPQRFCNDLADKKCAQNLTIIIEPNFKRPMGLSLIIKLAEIIEAGTYPNGTCLIFQTNSSLFDHEYGPLLRGLAKHSSVDKPELHLILPMADHNITFIRSERNIVRDCILYNKSLKTLILSHHSSAYFGEGHDDLFTALKINHTLTTFDCYNYIKKSIIYTFPGIRNQQLRLSGQVFTYNIMLDILKHELEMQAPTSELSDKIRASSFAILRYQDNLTLLFNPIFLEFFKKNVLLIMHKIWVMIFSNTKPRAQFDPIARTLLAAGNITLHDLDEDKKEVVDTKEVRGVLRQLVPPSIITPPLVLPPENKNEPILFFKDLNFAREVINCYPLDAGTQTNLIRYAQNNDLKNFQQTIITLFKEGRLALEEALQLAFLIKKTKSDLPISQFEKLINDYDEEKGRFRKFFNNCTKTVNDLKSLMEQAKKIAGNQTVSAFQIELCLTARDLRNSCFKRRSGIINQSVTFFKTGDLARSRKRSCFNQGPEALSKTEQLIEGLSRSCRNLI